MDMVKIQIAVEHFKIAIENIRTNLPPFENTTSNAINPHRKGRKWRKFKIVCKRIVPHYNFRECFAFKDHLFGSNLFLFRIQKQICEY